MNALLARILRFDRWDRHMREVVKGASVALFLKVVGVGLLFVLNVLVARMLGAHGAGIFFLSLTIVTVASSIGQLGLRYTFLRFSAALSSVGDWVSLKGLYRKGISMAAGATILMSLAGFAGAPWLAEAIFSKPEVAGPLRWMSLAIVPMALLFLHSELLKGLKRIFGAIFIDTVCIPVIGIPAIYILGRPWGIHGAVWGYNLAVLLTALLGFFWWRSATPQLRGIEGRFETREIFKSSMPLFWVNAMGLAMNWLSVIFLGVLSTAANVGIFSAALSTSKTASLLLMSFNSIVAPKIAELYKKGEMDALRTTVVYSTKLVVVFTSPVLLAFILAPGWIMAIFGSQFIAGAPALIILALGQMVNVFTGPVQYILAMSGNEPLLRNNTAAALGVCVVLNVLLVPSLGIMGAAIATAGSIVFRNLGAAYLVWSRLRIRTFPLSLKDLRWEKK